MKKTLAAAITSALVIGVASTTFAAANPFSDVPRDHWSFDAVAKLAQQGVIEGYGDNTFRGDAHITRYEMAQMVAKALAKDGVSGDAKYTLDRLSAEYADELNNLGVRVANLEERSDNVKITGLLRLDGTSIDKDWDDKDDSGRARLRLNLDAKVNADWHVKGRLDADHNLGDDTSSAVRGVRAYAEGPLFGATAKLGKFGTFDAEDLTTGGMIMDTEVSGAEFAFGDQLRTTVTYGRLGSGQYADDMYPAPGVSDYAAIQFLYTPADNWKLGAGYHYFKLKNSGTYVLANSNEDKNGVWQLGFDYSFNPDLTFGASYAASDVDLRNRFDDNEDSYSVQLTYKGAKSDVAGSYGLWLAYRQLGAMTSYAPTFDGVMNGTKGYELGVDYMLDKNILAKVVYFDGEVLEDGSDNDVNKIFGRVEFQF